MAPNTPSALPSANCQPHLGSANGPELLGSACGLHGVTTLALVACVSDRDSAGTTHQSTPTSVMRSTTTPLRATAATERPGQPPEPTPIEVRLAHYSIEPGANSAPNGRIILNVKNRYAVPHDVVLIRTSLPPDRLPTSGIRLDEASTCCGSPKPSMMGRRDRPS